MPYATEEELAAAVRVRVTAENEAGLTACLAAAQAEIDHEVDWTDPTEPHYPDGDPRSALLNRVNIARGVEWWKANDAAFGVIGTSDTGALTAPRDGFGRHRLALSPCKQRWGVA